MNIQATDAEAAAVAKAPRVQLADIEAAIMSRYDLTADKATGANSSRERLDLLSLCIIVMKNGFIVVGKSAPASPENFNADLGREFAYEDAIRQLWPLMGFALRDKLSASA